MAGSAISEMIFFIAAIMISSAVAVTLIGVIDDYSEDLGEEASVLRWEMRSQMKVINDPMYIPYDTSNGNLTFYVKNTGTGDLSIDELVVSANGTTGSTSTMWTRTLNGDEDWKPGSTIEVIFRVSGLKQDTDYNGWVYTSGITPTGSPRGTAEDNIVFRIMEV